MKMFEEYLPKWSEEKNQPIPTMDQMDRWSVAWKDFQNTVLREKHDDIAEEYKSMQLKTYDMLEKEKRKKKKEEIKKQEEKETVEEDQLSEWEKVQKYLNE